MPLSDDEIYQGCLPEAIQFMSLRNGMGTRPVNLIPAISRITEETDRKMFAICGFVDQDGNRPTFLKIGCEEVELEQEPLIKVTGIDRLNTLEVQKLQTNQILPSDKDIARILKQMSLSDDEIFYGCLPDIIQFMSQQNEDDIQPVKLIPAISRITRDSSGRVFAICGVVVGHDRYPTFFKIGCEEFQSEGKSLVKVTGIDLLTDPEVQKLQEMSILPSDRLIESILRQ